MKCEEFYSLSVCTNIQVYELWRFKSIIIMNMPAHDGMEFGNWILLWRIYIYIFRSMLNFCEEGITIVS